MAKLSVKNTGIYEELKRRILKNEFGRPGERFLSVRELAAFLAVRTETARLFCEKLCEESFIICEKQKYFLTHGMILRDSSVRQYRKERNIVFLLTTHLFSYYLPAFADKAAKVLEKRGYSMGILYLSEDNYREMVRMGYDMGAQGFLLLADRHLNRQICDMMYLPCVTSGEDLTAYGVDSVLSGGEKQAAHLAELMIESGCEEIFFAGLDREHIEVFSVFKAFREKLLEKRFPFKPDNIILRNELLHNRRFCAKRILETKTRAGVVCASEELCNLILLCCDENNILIPEKLMVATFRTKTIASRSNRKLISVEENIEHEATEAVRMLLERIDGYTEAPRCITIEPITMHRRI